MSSPNQIWSQFNSGIDGQFQYWNRLFKKNGIDKFGIEVSYKFQVGTRSTYSW